MRKTARRSPIEDGPTDRRIFARPSRQRRSRRSAAPRSEVAGRPRTEQGALEARQLSKQELEARIKELLAREEYASATALKEAMEREAADREAEQRAEGEQKERPGIDVRKRASQRSRSRHSWTRPPSGERKQGNGLERRT